MIHCFNHRLELALKDAFRQSPAFESIESFITNLYNLYQTSPKRLCCLSELVEAHEKSVQKPTKAGGNRWLDFKYTAMKNALEYFGIYLSHIEDLSNNDSQPKKWAELKGFLAKWEQATVSIHLAIYLDVLAPLRRLSLSLQSELHDPVKEIERVQQFTWTMSKQKLIIDASIENKENATLTHYANLTHYDRLLNEIKETEGAYLYQDITIKNFIASKNACG